VIAPGLLTTVQDLGRFGCAHLGISASGAADSLALRAGNLLVGNAGNAAALEMTLAGGTFAFDADTVVAIAGADFSAGLPLWAAVEVKAGTEVDCGSARTGARAYLCVRGGISVPLVLGSASTHLWSGIGGHRGRALRRGDVLAIGDAAIRPPRARPAAPPPPGDGVLHTTRGPQADWFDDAFYSAVWEVSEDSDRMGLRLRGPALSAGGGEMVTEGVALGAIQVPPAGQPIVVFVEHQTTGGYPKIANVISADLGRAGQLRPRERVRFEAVTLRAAYRRLRRQEEWLRGLV